MSYLLPGWPSLDEEEAEQERAEQRMSAKATCYHAEDRVEVFDPLLQRFVPGTVTGSTAAAVLVSLDDRMVGEMVDPADSHKIRPLEMTA